MSRGAPLHARGPEFIPGARVRRLDINGKLTSLQGTVRSVGRNGEAWVYMVKWDGGPVTPCADVELEPGTLPSLTISDTLRACSKSDGECARRCTCTS